jgi:multisubunit Na+/H+ antiporter MnhB subunit
VNQRTPALSRAVYAALAIVVLLGIVAIASRGHHAPGTGSGQARGPVQILFDVVFTLGIVGSAATLFMLAFFHAKSATEKRKGSYKPLVMIGVFALFLTIGLLVLPRIHAARKPGQTALYRSTHLHGTQAGALRQAKEPIFHWSVALGTIALLVAAFAVLIVRERRRRRGDARDWTAALLLADALDDTLDDLRAEPDPRRAIIAAYARMERALGLYGLPRRESEAPLEYMTRVLTELKASEWAIRRLTDLFALAKFSDHPVSEPMKDRAIGALEAIRDDLHALGRNDPPRLKRVPAEVAR